MLTAEPGGGSDLIARVIAQGLSASTEIIVSSSVGLSDTLRSEMTRMGKVIKVARIRLE